MTGSGNSRDYSPYGSISFSEASVVENGQCVTRNAEAPRQIASATGLAMLSYPATALAIASSWILTTTIDLRDRRTDVSATLVELDEAHQPIIMRLACTDGRPDFQFQWHDHTGPDLIVIEVGEGDGDRRNVGFRRDNDDPELYHLADNPTTFMARLVTYKKPTFFAHYADGSRLWTFETGETSEAWSRVSTACHS